MKIVDFLNKKDGIFRCWVFKVCSQFTGCKYLNKVNILVEDYLFIHLFTYLFIYLFIYLLIYLFTYLFIYLFIFDLTI